MEGRVEEVTVEFAVDCPGTAGRPVEVVLQSRWILRYRMAEAVVQTSGWRTAAGAAEAPAVVVVVEVEGPVGTAVVGIAVAAAFRQGVPACSLAGSWSCCVIARRVSTGRGDHSASNLHPWSEGCEMSKVPSLECYSASQDQLVAEPDTVLEELDPLEGVAKAHRFDGLEEDPGVRGPGKW